MTPCFPHLCKNRKGGPPAELCLRRGGTGPSKRLADAEAQNQKPRCMSPCFPHLCKNRKGGPRLQWFLIATATKNPPARINNTPSVLSCRKNPAVATA